MVASLVVLASPAGAVDGPVKVIAGPEDQYHPSADATHLIWTQNSEAKPNVDHAYGKVRGEAARFRLDADGTRGDAGGIDPNGERAVYQQMTDRASDLYWYRFADGTRKKIGIDGVNTRKWERDPRVSARLLFFARDAGSATSLFVYDFQLDQLTKIASYDITRFYVAPGAVGEQYATWTICGPYTCTAWWYDTQEVDARPHKLPSTEGRPQYAPVIDEIGNYVYSVRSGQACGALVGIWRRVWPLDPDVPAERLVRLPDGVDTGWTLSVERAPEQVNLWFSRYRCGPMQGDVAKLSDVETGP